MQTFLIILALIVGVPFLATILSVLYMLFGPGKLTEADKQAAQAFYHREGFGRVFNK